MTLSYDICVYILNDQPAISFGKRQGQSLQRHCGDRTEAAQSSCSHRAIFTSSAQKPYGGNVVFLPVPYDYLKSL